MDGVSKTDKNMLSGRMENTKIVNFPGPETLCGRYVRVRVTEAHTWSLNGVLENEGTADNKYTEGSI